jgi:hypothetical protein
MKCHTFSSCMRKCNFTYIIKKIVVILKFIPRNSQVLEKILQVYHIEFRKNKCEI